MMSTQTSSDVSLEFALAVKNRENDFNSEDEEDISFRSFATIASSSIT